MDHCVGPVCRKNSVHEHFALGHKFFLICQYIERHDGSNQEIFKESQNIEHTCGNIFQHILHLRQNVGCEIFLCLCGILVHHINGVRIHIPAPFYKGIHPVFDDIHIIREAVDDVHDTLDQLRQDHHDQCVDHNCKEKHGKENADPEYGPHPSLLQVDLFLLKNGKDDLLFKEIDQRA